MPSCRRATYSRKLFSGFPVVPVPAKGPPLPRTSRLPSRAALRWSDMWSALTICPCRTPLTCGLGCNVRLLASRCLLLTTPKFYAWQIGASVRVPTQSRNFRGCTARKQERSHPKNVARQPGRYQPLSAAWQREVPLCKPEAPGGTSHFSARADPRVSPDLHRPHRPKRFAGFARDGATAPGAPPQPADRFDRTTPDRSDTA